MPLLYFQPSSLTRSWFVKFLLTGCFISSFEVKDHYFHFMDLESKLRGAIRLVPVCLKSRGETWVWRSLNLSSALQTPSASEDQALWQEPGI